MIDLTAKLRDIHARASALASLAPGGGYDALGFALCELVSRSVLSHDARAALLAELPQNVIAELPQISVAAEAAMDAHHAKLMLSRLADPTLLRALSALLPEARFSALLGEYPYDWAQLRARELRRLLDAGCVVPPPGYLLIGESNLPLSGLALHSASGRPVRWVDLKDNSRARAAQFLSVLVAVGLLDQAGVEMQAAGDPPPGWVTMLLDQSASTAPRLQRAHEAGAPLIRLEPMGLARLMYPAAAPACPQDHGYRLTAVLLPQHVADEPLPEGVVRLVAESPGLYLAMCLYLPA